MDLLIDWLYTDFKESLTLEQRQALFELSHKYNITELRQECERVLSSSVSFDTYAILAGIAEQFESHCLKQARITTVQCISAFTHVH